jgi:ketosteroid isomerase-like protein
MESNTQLIEKFYIAIANKDTKTIEECYSADIAFYDPAFELLKGEQVTAMWRMLLSRAKNFSLNYSNIKDLGEGYYTCDWVAKYTFSKTNRPVVNNGKAHMLIKDGKIVEHSDGWSFAKWSAQALGIMGTLFGWLGLFRRRVQNDARKGLLKFIAQEQQSLS